MGLTAYRTLAGRKPAPDYVPAAPRPKGELVWVHAGEAGNTRAIADLAQRLAIVRPGCTVLLTGTDADIPHQDGLIWDRIDNDHPDTAGRFIDHWAPDVLIWSWGGLRPNLILAAKASGAHMMLVDAGKDGFDRQGDRWLPEVPRRLLAQFDVVVARSQAAYARLAQLGRPLGDIELSRPLRPFGHTLPVNDSDITDVSECLHGRPVWLAAHVHRDEITTVIAAHRQGLKATHRLLLILLLADPSTLDHAVDTAAKRGLKTAIWTDGVYPDEHCQVLVSDASDELGLWLRVAPVAFLGGSLSDGTPDTDPYTAAAHGSAVVYGPYVPTYAEGYKRLLAAGAARIINDASSMGLAVSQMVAPDRAAEMAMAGWELLTEGADDLEHILGHVQTHLETLSEENG